MNRSLYQFYGRRLSRPLKTYDKNLLKDHPNVLDVVKCKDILSHKKDGRVAIEIGFGDGVHLVNRALEFPGVFFIACDPFLNGVVKILKNIDRSGVFNIGIFPEDARYMLDNLPDCSINEAFILFPDPWPKLKHQKRRFINDDNIAKLSRILKKNEKLTIATDDEPYREWILDHMRSLGMFVEAPCNEEGVFYSRPATWFQTRYEKKALEQGKRCYYMEFVNQARPS